MVSVTLIAVGKIKEKYYRPVVIVTDSGNGIVKGTGRSVPGIDLHALLGRYSHLFMRFGGHAGACGFSMSSEHVDHLRECLNDDVRKMLDDRPGLLDYVLVPDAVITGFFKVTPAIVTLVSKAGAFFSAVIFILTALPPLL